MGVGQGKGGESGVGEGGVSLPVLDGDAEWKTEERNAVRQRELVMVIKRVPGGRGTGEREKRKEGEGDEEDEMRGEEEKRYIVGGGV